MRPWLVQVWRPRAQRQEFMAVCLTEWHKFNEQMTLSTGTSSAHTATEKRKRARKVSTYFPGKWSSLLQNLRLPRK